MDILYEDLRLNGLTIDDPSVRREWFAEWVRSENLLVYILSKNYATLQQSLITLTNLLCLLILVSLILTVSCASDGQTNPVICTSWKNLNELNKQISDLATHIAYFKEKYRPQAITIDGGGLGLKVLRRVESTLWIWL